MFCCWFCVTIAVLSGHQTPPAEEAPRTPSLGSAFSQKTFAEAAAASEGAGNVSIIVFSAEWCDQSVQMSAGAFADERVVRWFRGDSVEGTRTALKVDIEQFPDLAREWGIGRVPMTIAFRGREPVKRLLGVRTPDELVEWLEGVRLGQAVEDFTPSATDWKQVSQSACDSLSHRIQRFSDALHRDHDLNRATVDAIELWQLRLRDSRSFIPDLAVLAESHPPAKAAFGKLRQNAWETFVNGSDRRRHGAAIHDWVTLNIVLREPTLTLSWFDRASRDPDGQKLLEGMASELEDVLYDHGRVSEICLLYADPINLASRHAALRARAAEAPKKVEVVFYERRNQERLLRLYASLLLAGRPNDARKFAAELLQGPDSPTMRIALVKAALQHRAGNQDHWAMLDAADKAGEAVDGLRIQLEQQAGKPNTSFQTEPDR